MLKGTVTALLSKNFILSVIIIAAGIIAFMVLNANHKRLLKKTLNPDYEANKFEKLLRLTFNISKYVLLLVVILAVFEVNGINIGSLVASVGLLGAMIVFALQDLFKDILGGAHIVNDHFFSVGDVVRYNDIEGEVVSMSIMATKLKDISNGNVITISNREISAITKLSHQVDIDIPLSYDDDTAYIRKTLTSTAEKLKALDTIEDAVFKGTQSFDESAAIYKIRFWCDPHDKWDVWRQALGLVQDELDGAGLKIPYKHLELLKSGERNADAPSVSAG